MPVETLSGTRKRKQPVLFYKDQFRFVINLDYNYNSYNYLLCQVMKYFVPFLPCAIKMSQNREYVTFLHIVRCEFEYLVYS